MKKYPRLDSNHRDIVEALRKCGCSVLSLASLGNGAPDALVVRHSRSWLIEIKDNSKPPSHRRLTPDEERFHENWRGPIHIVGSVDEAVNLVNS